MDLRRLRSFLAVAEELHFGKAAARLNISQPPLSQQVRELEDELGARLFTRTSRSVALTEAGKALREEAQAVFARLNQAEARVRAVARGEIGRLRVGFVRPALDSGLPEAIRAFRREVPDAVLELKELGTKAQLDAFAANALDVGFVRLFGHDLAGLSAELFVREPYVLALPKGHRLAKRPRVALGALAGLDFIFYPRRTGPALYDRMLACCRAAGFTPNIVQETETKPTALALVAAGLGAAFVPASSAGTRPREVDYRPIDGDLPLVELWTVRPSAPASPLAVRFADTARACARLQAPD